MKSFTSNVTSKKPVPTVYNRNSTEVKRNAVNRTDSNASNFSDTDRLSKELISTIEKENVTEVRRLIDEGANVNFRDEYNTNPLYTAFKVGHFTMITLLINKGADVNAKTTFYNLAPLHGASLVGYKEIVEFLIAKGADVNIKSDPHNITPLHIASREGHTAIVELLIDKGADVNAKFNIETECYVPLARHNGTPLHCASEQGYTEIVALLIARGADVSARDILNKTPLDYALEKGHTEIVSLLTAQREASMNKVHLITDPTISPYETIYLAIQQIIGAIWIICADARQTLAAFIQDTIDMFSLAKEGSTLAENTPEKPCKEKENLVQPKTRSDSLLSHRSFAGSEKDRKEKSTALQR